SGSSWSCAGVGRALRARREARREPRLVAAGGVLVNNPFACHPIDQRNRVFQRRLRAGQIVAVDGGADALQRAAEPRPELPVVLAVLQTLPVRLERGCVRSHVIYNLRKLLILAQWP